MTALRVWIEGVEPALRVEGDRAECVATSDLPDAEPVALSFDELPVALVAWLGLGPRPRPDDPAVRLSPGAMAVLIGRRQAHGHGLPADQATALQRRLDAGVRHWSVRLEDGGGRRRNLEVVEGTAAGIWRVRPAGDLVELAPTTTTEVVRELVEMLG
jgi:hypothetical protein